MKLYRITQTDQISVFHGSDNPFEGFDPSKSESGYYTGFYVTSDINMSESFGHMIYEFKLTPSKYYYLPDNKASEDLKIDASKAGHNVNGGSGHGECEYLKSLGYHGIRRGKTYVVFDPETSLKFVGRVS